MLSEFDSVLLTVEVECECYSEAVYSGWFGKHGDTRLGLLVKGDEVRWTSASEFRDILRDLG